MTKCELCLKGDPSIAVRCHYCREVSHVHQSQLDIVPEGSIVIGDCPTCGASNCWQKRGGKIRCSGPVIYSGQPIPDMRRKRRKSSQI